MKNNNLPYAKKINKQFMGNARFVIVNVEDIYTFHEFSSYQHGFDNILRDPSYNVLIVYDGVVKNKLVRDIITRAVGELNSGKKINLENVLK